MINKKNDPYKDSGVDIKKGEDLVEWLKESEDDDSNTFTLGKTLSGIGGFAALFQPNFKNIKEPVIIASTDGVGTKLLLGLENNNIEGLGIDLVAMCVNDLYCVGGRPLFFLDYYATSALDDSQFKSILSGIKKGLQQSNAVLLGGETAELPGLYSTNHFDLAGFVVGVVDKSKIIQPPLVKVTDKLFALKSSGFHSNGYSLIRSWVKQSKVAPDIIAKLLIPTKIYHELPTLFDKLGTSVIHAVANITGGGISGNLPRVMPDDVCCVIQKDKIPTPNWMRSFIAANDSNFDEVEHVFNMGAGMILAIDAKKADIFVKEAKALSLDPVLIGELEDRSDDERLVYKN